MSGTALPRTTSGDSPDTASAMSCQICTRLNPVSATKRLPWDIIVFWGRLKLPRPPTVARGIAFDDNSLTENRYTEWLEQKLTALQEQIQEYEKNMKYAIDVFNKDMDNTLGISYAIKKLENILQKYKGE